MMTAGVNEVKGEDGGKEIYNLQQFHMSTAHSNNCSINIFTCHICHIQTITSFNPAGNAIVQSIPLSFSHQKFQSSVMKGQIVAFFFDFFAKVPRTSTSRNWFSLFMSRTASCQLAMTVDCRLLHVSGSQQQGTFSLETRDDYHIKILIDERLSLATENKLIHDRERSVTVDGKWR